MIIKYFVSEVFSVCFITEKSREKRNDIYYNEMISCSSTNRWVLSISRVITKLKRTENPDSFQMIVNAFAKRSEMYQGCVGYSRLGLFIKRKYLLYSGWRLLGFFIGF